MLHALLLCQLTLHVVILIKSCIAHKSIVWYLFGLCRCSRQLKEQEVPRQKPRQIPKISISHYFTLSSIVYYGVRYSVSGICREN